MKEFLFRLLFALALFAAPLSAGAELPPVATSAKTFFSVQFPNGLSMADEVTLRNAGLALQPLPNGWLVSSRNDRTLADLNVFISTRISASFSATALNRGQTFIGAARWYYPLGVSFDPGLVNFTKTKWGYTDAQAYAWLAIATRLASGDKVLMRTLPVNDPCDGFDCYWGLFGVPPRITCVCYYSDVHDDEFGDDDTPNQGEF